ncbi:TPA: hypothetical protein DEP58_05595, partial [Patescibacteria group bacterium]|nr:hypothetical protein [Patescibacteria group bacterium]
TKKAQTVGCRVETGELSVKDRIIIKKGDVELGRGRILSMKSGKTDTSRVGENNDCGLQMEVALETEPVYNDSIIAFTVTEN